MLIGHSEQEMAGILDALVRHIHVRGWDISPEKIQSLPYWCKKIFKDFIYLFLERWAGREKERERNIDV